VLLADIYPVLVRLWVSLSLIGFSGVVGVVDKYVWFGFGGPAWAGVLRAMKLSVIHRDDVDAQRRSLGWRALDAGAIAAKAETEQVNAKKRYNNKQRSA